MSSAMETAPVAFMAPRPAAPVERPRGEPPAAPRPQLGSDAAKKPDAPAETKLPFDPAQSARAPEPPSAPEPAKITELPKSVVSASKPEHGANGTALPSISNLDAPPQPPKEPTESNAPGLSAPAAAASGLLKPSLPKPVEVISAPDTPVYTGTPAGGTPRPELTITQEPIKKPEPQAAETKPAAPTSAPDTAAKSEHAVNGSSAGLSAVAGQKRKLDEEDGDDKTKASEPEHAEKKAKLVAEPAANGATTAGAEPAKEAAPGDPSPRTPAPQKVGRPRKDKKEKKAAPAPVGRTQRKTRSQGPAETSL